MDAKTHLDNFLKALMTPDALVEDVTKYLTVTQQHEMKYIGRITPVNSLNGLHSLFTKNTHYKLKEKISSNKVMKDCTIELKNSIEGREFIVQCRLVKEKGVREVGEDGVWGVNASSFRYTRTK